MRRLLPLVVVALAVAGCGSSTNGEQSKPPPKILSDAKQAAQSAKSVHVVGSGNGSALDLVIAGAQGAKGSITQQGQTIQLVRTSGTFYLNATEQFYRQHGAPAAIASRLGGRWLKAPASQPSLTSFIESTDPATLFPRLLTPRGTPTKTGQVTVNGTKAVRLTDGTHGTLDISLTGKPYPLRLATPTGGFTFSDWNKPVTLTAPPGAIDTSSLR